MIHHLTSLFQLLLQGGASVNARDNDFSQATHAAANFDHAEALNLLLEHGTY